MIHISYLKIMNIGDRVRLLHSKEEGIITRFLKNDVVEVEIEEGFRLPLMKRELAIISKTENIAFKTQLPAGGEPHNQAIIPRKTPEVKAEKGIFMAFVPVKTPTGEAMSLHIINNTDWDLPFSLIAGSDKNRRGIMGGFLKSKTFQKAAIDLVMKDFDEWGTFSFSAFYYTNGFLIEKPTFAKKMRMRANAFFQNKKNAPLLDKEAILFQLDAEDTPVTLNVEELKEKMFESNTEQILTKQFAKPAAEIDLHIEQLTKNFMGMSNAEILELQLKTFENHLEKAIAGGMDEVFFIHGVGNGVLSNEIHRRLSKHKNVGFFQDAQKEKFGYGATKVKIK
jgi:DNA-nicking Smr family endonuclease